MVNILFVYGTLREDAGHEMFRILGTNASRVGDATVRGRLYSLGDYPALVPDEHASHVVKGELYRLHEAALQRTLRVLDNYEGLSPDEPEPHEYRRELVSATLRDGRGYEAWAYVLNRSIEGLPRIESGDFTEWRQSGRTA